MRARKPKPGKPYVRPCMEREGEEGERDHRGRERGLLNTVARYPELLLAWTLFYDEQVYLHLSLVFH